MTLFKDKYRVESTRLAGWDYGAAGYYFVTICTHERACFLGEICDGGMELSPQGVMVAEEWQRTESIRNNVALDAWVIMPNHFHAIIALKSTPVETPPLARLGVTPPQRGVSTGLKPGSLGAIINQFKSVCSKRIRAAGYDFGWQARYYEQIVRDDKSLREIREYIVNNPLKWELDKNNPKNM